MNDDFAADVSTTGIFTIFGSAVAGRFEELGDVDWIRVEGLMQYFFYDAWLWRSTDDDFISFADVEVLGPQSNLIFSSDSSQRVPGSFLYHHRGSSVPHFFSLAERTGTGGYRLFVRPSDLGGDSLEEAEEFAPTTFRRFASALEKNSDRDFLKYRLFKDVPYTFRLRGKEAEDAIGTTLERKAFRLFDVEGNLLMEDDTNGVSRVATISYTPAETNEYILEVDSNEATGSYIIESHQLDDYLNNITTDGFLPLDGSTIQAQGNFGFASQLRSPDDDWFRIDTQNGFTYTIASDVANIDLRDRNGVFVRDIEFNFSATGRRKFSFTAGEGPYFVSATNRSLDQFEYLLTGQAIDDHIATLFGATHFVGNSAFGSIEGAIESVGDRDWIRVQSFQQLANYRLTIDADPELRMAVSARDSDGNIVAEGKSLTPLIFSKTETNVNGPVYLDVRSNANRTGAWKLNFRAIQGGLDASTGWTVDLSKGVGRIRSLAEGYEGAKTRWHRFEVKPDTWYEIQSTSPVNFDVRFDNDTTPVARYTSGKRYYYSGSSSDTTRYIVIDPESQDFNGQRGFEIGIVEDARSRLRSGGELRPGNQRFGNEVVGFQNIEVISSIPFEYLDEGQTVQVDQHTYAVLSPEQWYSIGFPTLHTGEGEMFYRDVRPQGAGQWSSRDLYGNELPAGLSRIRVGSRFTTLSYAFAEGRPAYIPGDDPVIGVTEALSESERAAVSDAIFQWDRHISSVRTQMIQPGVDNDAASIMIFKAEIDSDVLAFPLNDSLEGPGLAGDIVLNVNSPLWDDFTRGTKSPFELLRAVGKTLGLSELDAVPADISVMGADLAALDAFAYPSSLLPGDIQSLRSPLSVFRHPQSNSNPRYVLDENAPVFETIVHNGEFDNSSITAEQTNLNAKIDLRSGQSSWLTVGATRPAVWHLSKYSVVRNGYGGNGDDTIRGNEFVNVLIGGDGDDLLIGAAGDDRLYGGPGDDFYSYRVGHGSDRINEFGGGGTETLRIDGHRNFDGIEDLQFQRLGRDLIISLELDGRDKNADTIIIEGMAESDFAVERLALLSDGNFIGSISLISAFAESNQQLRRLQLTPGSDEFGRLVTPA